MKTNEASPSREVTAGPERRAPDYWRIGLGMLGVVVLVTVGALYLADSFRPKIGSVPVAVTPTAVPTEAPASVSTTTSVATAPNVTIDRNLIRESATLLRATSTPVTQPAVTAPHEAISPTPIAFVSGAFRAAVPPPPDVVNAYLRYWDLYSEALLSLDSDRLAEVAGGDELVEIREEIEAMRRDRQAIRARVTHSYIVYDVTDSGAKVYDEIVDRSFVVDATSRQPTDVESSGTVIKGIYHLIKSDGSWKVVKCFRQE